MQPGPEYELRFKQKEKVLGYRTQECIRQLEAKFATNIGYPQIKKKQPAK